MSDQVWTLLIATIQVIALAYISTKYGAKVDSYHKAVNSKMDKFLRLTKETGELKGRVDERADAKRRLERD